MTQLLEATDIISDLSTALANLAERVDKATGRKKSSDGLSAARAVQNVRARSRDVESQAQIREMAEVAYGLNERLVAMPIPDWMAGTSVTCLRTITASNKQLMNLTNDRSLTSAITPERYAILAKAAFVLIRDLSDYMRAVTISQIEQVRSQNFMGDMAVDMRPAPRSAEAAARGSSGAYGRDEDDDASSAGSLSSLGFDESEMDALSGDLSVYNTPSASASTTPAVSRSGSPEPDLMGAFD